MLAVHFEHCVKSRRTEFPPGQQAVEIREVILPAVAPAHSVAVRRGVSELGIRNEPVRVAHMREDESANGLRRASAEGASSRHPHAYLGREPRMAARNAFAEQIVTSENGAVGKTSCGEVAPRKARRRALDRDEWCDETHTEIRVGSPNQCGGIKNTSPAFPPGPFEKLSTRTKLRTITARLNRVRPGRSYDLSIGGAR